MFQGFKIVFRQIRDFWTLLNKYKRVEKTDLCEWTSQTLEKSLTDKNIKSGFRKTRIWPYNEHAVLSSMQPSRGFEEAGRLEIRGGGIWGGEEEAPSPQHSWGAVQTCREGSRQTVVGGKISCGDIYDDDKIGSRRAINN